MQTFSLPLILNGTIQRPPDLERLAAIQPLLDHRGMNGAYTSEAALYYALATYEPMGLLINSTMKEALPVAGVG